MIRNKKIAIITTNSFGYIDFVAEKLRDKNIDLLFINIDAIPFSYSNKLVRFFNLFLKLILGFGLKEINRTDFIINAIKKRGKLDQVLIIRPDKLQKKALVFVRENCTEMSTFLFDGIENFKEQKKLLSYFDSVYSYDRNDVTKYNLKFLTNFIFDDSIETTINSQKVFNISSFDNRFVLLEKLALELKKNNISYRFIVKKKKHETHSNVEIIDKYLPLNEVKKIIAASDILVDIQKEKQTGLSFRVFESLGYNKKLITNNPDIKNYDFYDERNIYVLEGDDFSIPKEFFESEYIKVSPKILENYKLDCWIKKVFNV